MNTTPNIVTSGYDELMHKVWANWRKVRNTVYKRLNVNNTMDLISAIKNGRITLAEFLDSIRESGVGELTYGYNTDVNVYNNSKNNVRLISIFDRDYPQELLNMQDINESIYPPLVLYALGSASLSSMNINKTIIAIVGTRECTNEGAKMAYDIAYTLAGSNKFIIATGLARGIDYYATLGALDASDMLVNPFSIIGVRPYLSPIDYVNEELCERILKHGCIMAENLDKINDSRWIRMNLYLRNRIIAGISKAVIVVEARARKGSGSMHQLDFALRRNKPVLIWHKDEYNNNMLRVGSRAELFKGYEQYIAEGAIKFKDVDELIDHLKSVR